VGGGGVAEGGWGCLGPPGPATAPMPPWGGGGGVSEGVWAVRHVGGGVRVGSYGGSVKEAREAMVPLVTAGRASAVLL
jgi:hypothetical protein